MMTGAMMMMMITMMAVIALIKYFRLLLAHQRVHLIFLLLLPSIQANQETGACDGARAAAATPSKHRRKHVVLVSLHK